MSRRCWKPSTRCRSAHSGSTRTRNNASVRGHISGGSMRTDPPHTAHPDARDGETEPAHPAAGALDGFRVLELGTLIAGPYCGRLLGDMGADVIKIEAPDRPDPLRDWGQAAGGGHQYFWTVHARNKRCVSLDLRVPAG